MAVCSANAQSAAIGSKKFTESYVLGEIAKRTLNDAGVPAEHRQGIGGTIILWQALRGGQVDAYPEYTGTIAQEILIIGPIVAALWLVRIEALAGLSAKVSRRDHAPQ